MRIRRRGSAAWGCLAGLAICLVWLGMLIERHFLGSASHAASDKPPLREDVAKSSVAESEATQPSAITLPLEQRAYVEKFAAFLERFPGGEVRVMASGDLVFDPTPGDLSFRPGAPPFISRGSEEFDLVDESFVLTRQAFEALSLTQPEAIGVQAALRTLRESYRREFAERAEADPLRTDADAGVYAFSIPAFVAESKSMLAKFGDQISELIGDSRYQRLMEIFNMPDHLAAFGTSDLFVRFHDAEYDGVRSMRADWEERHPTTGAEMGGTQARMDIFEAEFGSIFSIEETAP